MFPQKNSPYLSVLLSHPDTPLLQPHNRRAQPSWKQSMSLKRRMIP